MDNKLPNPTNVAEDIGFSCVVGENTLFRSSSKMARSPPIATPETESHLQEFAITTDSSKESVLEKLGIEIRFLVDMLKDGTRRSIHQPMRDTIENIRVCYTEVATQMCDKRAAELLKESSTQTSPWLKNIQDNKRKTSCDTETPTPKRSRSKPAHNKVSKKATPKTPRIKHTETKSKEKATPKGTSITTRERPCEEEWKKVSRKKTRKKPKPAINLSRRPRPDAIVIGLIGDQSYADILRSVKSDPKLAKLGEAVTRIRRTLKGELLLQLKDSGENTCLFKDSIREKLGDKAEVRSLTQRIIVEIRDVDEITSTEDVIAAIKAQLDIDELPDKAVRLRNAYGGTQIATISLPGEAAKSLIGLDKIKIGWTVCRIRERKVLKKCFRCLEFGHFAAKCSSQEDRSKLCRKCGEANHIAKDCEAEPLCMFCKTDRQKDAKHMAGSSRCPMFKRALKDRQYKE